MNTQPTIFMARRKIGSGVCTSTAPMVPPPTIMNAVSYSSAPRWPPSIALPPRMATNETTTPAKLRMSMPDAVR